MKKLVKLGLLAGALLFASSFSFGQSSNLHGKARSAANDCIQSSDFQGLGLQVKSDVYEVGTCGDGSSQYAVDIFAVGHCPQPQTILCLVIRIDIATVYFDCNENLSGIVCYE